MQTLKDLVVRFDINPEHTLKQQNHEQLAQDDTHYETCWYIEKDEQKRIVARYRSWSNQGMHAPYRLQLGWERYTPEGMLMEREVRYATRDDKDALH